MNDLTLVPTKELMDEINNRSKLALLISSSIPKSDGIMEVLMQWSGDNMKEAHDFANYMMDCDRIRNEQL